MELTPERMRQIDEEERQRSLEEEYRAKVRSSFQSRHGHIWAAAVSILTGGVLVILIWAITRPDIEDEDRKAALAKFNEMVDVQLDEHIYRRIFEGVACELNGRGFALKQRLADVRYKLKIEAERLADIR